jgi:hypothetical protein
VIEDSLEFLVNPVTWDSLALRVNQGLLDCLDPEGQRVSASKGKEETMVRNIPIKWQDETMGYVPTSPSSVLLITLRFSMNLNKGKVVKDSSSLRNRRVYPKVSGLRR